MEFSEYYTDRQVWTMQEDRKTVQDKCIDPIFHSLQNKVRTELVWAMQADKKTTWDNSLDPAFHAFHEKVRNELVHHNRFPDLPFVNVSNIELLNNFLTVYFFLFLN